MIHKDSTVTIITPRKHTIRMNIDKVMVGDILMGFDHESCRVSYTRITSMVKVKLPVYHVKTSTFDVLKASELCHFFAFDGMKVPWNPVHDSIDLTTRLMKTRYSMGSVFTPFVLEVTKTPIIQTFYDLKFDKDITIFVDYYCKKMGVRR